MALQIGDKVAYSATFLRSIGCVAGSAPFAEGIIIGIKTLGTRQIMTVAWDHKDVPPKVMSANLARVGTAAMYAD